jgi:hypothetical protein
VEDLPMLGNVDVKDGYIRGKKLHDYCWKTKNSEFKGQSFGKQGHTYDVRKHLESEISCRI